MKKAYWYKIYVNSTLTTLSLFDVSNIGLPSDPTSNAVKRSVDEAIILWEKRHQNKASSEYAEETPQFSLEVDV